MHFGVKFKSVQGTMKCQNFNPGVHHAKDVHYHFELSPRVQADLKCQVLKCRNKTERKRNGCIKYVN